MRRNAAPALIAALAAALLTGASAASTVPDLRSATAKRGHVVVTLSLGMEFAPGRILVATRRAVAPGGRLLAANVRLNEPLRVVKTATGFRARTRHALKPGVYYVQISGVVVGLDCTARRPCPQRWSNVRRVRVPRS